MYKIFSILSVIAVLCLQFQMKAQETPLQLQYRDMAVEYSHDLKSAEKAIEASLQMLKSADKDLYPKLSGSADFQYTGNPLQLSLNLPAADRTLTFTGKDTKYGVGVTLSQPVYTGGRLLETIRTARYLHDITIFQEELIRSEVCCHADVQYWTTVARKEIMGIMSDYYSAVEVLTETIRQRVEAGMTDQQDLLMMEVKLNEASLQLAQAKKDFDNSMLVLNSLVGLSLGNQTHIDDNVSMIADKGEMALIGDRPEMKIAETQVKIAESERRLTASKYKPQLSVGVDGTYSSPGYNFHSDLDPNYYVYARMSVPLFEWGKRRNDLRASEMRKGMAIDNVSKTNDNVSLEIATARNSLSQSMLQVKLAQSSLGKALDNENMAIERYNEGKASVIELIEAQTYRQAAQINFVKAKVYAQHDYSMLKKAINGFQ